MSHLRVQYFSIAMFQIEIFEKIACRRDNITLKYFNDNTHLQKNTFENSFNFDDSSYDYLFMITVRDGITLFSMLIAKMKSIYFLSRKVFHKNISYFKENNEI